MSALTSYAKLEAIVNEKGLSFYRIAKDIGITPVVFTDWKNGKSVPKTDKLLKIADYLGVDIRVFVFEDS